jgi:hypothetical protein
VNLVRSPGIDNQPGGIDSLDLFLGSLNVRQVRTRDTVLVRGKEMTGRSQTPAVVAGGGRGKDDRKLNTLAPLVSIH